MLARLRMSADPLCPCGALGDCELSAVGPADRALQPCAAAVLRGGPHLRPEGGAGSRGIGAGAVPAGPGRVGQRPRANRGLYWGGGARIPVADGAPVARRPRPRLRGLGRPGAPAHGLGLAHGAGRRSAKAPRHHLGEAHRAEGPGSDGAVDLGGRWSCRSGGRRGAPRGGHRPRRPPALGPRALGAGAARGAERCAPAPRRHGTRRPEAGDVHELHRPPRPVCRRGGLGHGRRPEGLHGLLRCGRDPCGGLAPRPRRAPLDPGPRCRQHLAAGALRRGASELRLGAGPVAGVGTRVPLSLPHPSLALGLQVRVGHASAARGRAAAGPGLLEAPRGPAAAGGRRRGPPGRAPRLGHGPSDIRLLGRHPCAEGRGRGRAGDGGEPQGVRPVVVRGLPHRQRAHGARGLGYGLSRGRA
mmetsp:Transcript_52466/g.170412  ORF Transcript_52466/g.170412 Transcript_52466/m.170412 type:complete len:416 (-) Transcript_52466:784-2031(-)